MPFIYKVTNTVNGKVYVGQTTATVEERWRWHRNAAGTTTHPHKSALHEAMRKYGKDKFVVETIEECKCENLNEREKYWIARLDTYRNGYNLTTGGDGYRTIDEVEVERILALWGEGKNQAEIGKITGRDGHAVRRILYGNGVTKEEVRERQNAIYREKYSKPVYVYDMNGNFTAEYPSIDEASKATGVHKSTIGHIIHGRYESSRGLVFRLYKCDKIEFHKTVMPKKQTVFQYELDGTYVASYSSMLEAARAVGMDDAHIISDSCKNQKSIAAGYQWRHFKADRIEPADLKDGRHIAGGGRGKRWQNQNASRKNINQNQN